MNLIDLLPLIFRGIERTIVTIFGGLCIYWGYKLFAQFIQGETDFEGQKGEAKIRLRKVAPGTLFALFGSVLLSIVLSKSLDIKYPKVCESNQSKNGEKVQDDVTTSSKQILWATPQGFSDADTTQLNEALYAISSILSFADTDKPPIDDVEKNELDTAYSKLRLHRNFLIDKMYNRKEGALNLYTSWKQQIAITPNFLETLSAEDKQLFNNVDQWMRK